MPESPDNDEHEAYDLPEPDTGEPVDEGTPTAEDFDAVGRIVIAAEDEVDDSETGLPQVVTRRHDGSAPEEELPESLQDHDPMIGRKFGGFEITERIGHGGMGTVYKGKQVSLDREVAIKILNAQLVDNTEFIRRFQREAKSIARISHPNIVAVHDFGESAGHHYMVIEYVKGTNLSRMIAEKLVLTVDEFLPILLQSIDGLEHVAKSGIVHRDIKPDNILIDENGTAKLADFGLAKSMDATQDTDLTAHGSAMGTPAYMSPEQCMGRHLDIRSDIYSLGVTAYYALTGEKPFTGQSSFEIMTKHREYMPPPPGQLNPQLPSQVSEAIMRILAKEPRERCESAAECRDQWTQIAEGLGIRTGHRSGEWSALTDPFAVKPDPVLIPVDGIGFGPESAIPEPTVPEALPPAMMPEIDLGPAPLPSVPSAAMSEEKESDRRIPSESFESSSGSGTSSYRKSSSHAEERSPGSESDARQRRSTERTVDPDVDVNTRERRRAAVAAATHTCPSCGMLNHASDAHCQRCGYELIDPKSLSFEERQQRADDLFRKQRWKEAATAYGRLAESVSDRRQRSVLRSKEREARCNYEEQVYESLVNRSQELMEKGDFSGGMQLLERGIGDTSTSAALSTRLTNDLTTLRAVRRKQFRRYQISVGVLLVLSAIVLAIWYFQEKIPGLREHLPTWLKRTAVQVVEPVFSGEDTP